MYKCFVSLIKLHHTQPLEIPQRQQRNVCDGKNRLGFCMSSKAVVVAAVALVVVIFVLLSPFLIALGVGVDLRKAVSNIIAQPKPASCDPH